LRIKTHNEGSKNNFSYFTEPNTFKHGLKSKYGDVAAPIFQNLENKLQWVDINSGVFC